MDIYIDHVYVHRRLLKISPIFDFELFYKADRANLIKRKNYISPYYDIIFYGKNAFLVKL